jgi:glycosyltransferase involved in cell wall biosynthesis
LFVAQWLPMKGIEALRKAFIDLARRDPDLRLVCAGTLLSGDQVRAAFPEDVRARVSVIARVDQPGLVDLYRQADAFVFPSNYEGFGLALVEAMAARLPIVTTAVGVAADALVDRVSALFVPRRDAAALARAIDELRADAPLRSRLGEHAFVAAQKYREADHVRAWADALTSIDRVS